MIAHGKAPFLECSSKGDSRFSAFNARIRGRGNKSIEEIYQGAKVFDDRTTGLGWREAKGKRATNMPEVALLYATLWDEYINENVQLKAVLTNASGLSDRFGQAGHCCQATELWRIRENILLAYPTFHADMIPMMAHVGASKPYQSDLFDEPMVTSNIVPVVAATGRRRTPN